jgi:putative thioredoxin
MIDATLSTFERDVIEASMEVPVLVDFWAPWCGPCKVLGPLLEKLEREYGGHWKLVKVNSDTNPELASTFNLRSIPYTVAFVDGNAVAQFMGAQPEAYVRAFLDRLIPNPGELEHRAARDALALGQQEIARQYLKNALALDPTNDGARLDMVNALLEGGEEGDARKQFDILSTDAEQQSNYEAVRSRLIAAERAATLPPEGTLIARVDAAPTTCRRGSTSPSSASRARSSAQRSSSFSRSCAATASSATTSGAGRCWRCSRWPPRIRSSWTTFAAGSPPCCTDPHPDAAGRASSNRSPGRPYSFGGAGKRAASQGGLSRMAA